MAELYLSSSFFMILILLILFVRIWSYIEWSESKKYALIFVGMVALYVLMDALFVRGFLDESRNVTGFKVTVFLFYIVYVIMPYVWHLFMESYMGITCRKIILFQKAVPLFILLGMVVCSASTGIVWRVRQDGEYIRGSLFSIFAVLNLFYYVLAFVRTLWILFTNNKKGKKYILESAVFSAIPLIGILVNTYVIPLYGVYPFQPYCLVLGVLLAYLFMVENQKNKLESEHREMLSSALELEKEASQKAREAGAVKNTFLANMSHDIRTPMNAILGFADIIARHPDDETTVRNAVGKIQVSGDILLKIINDVLDLSRIESGKIKIEEKAVDLRKMSENLQMMLEYSIKKKNIDFEIVDNIENPYVYCDITKLQQILVNVLNNAVKFTPEGGKIRLSYEQEILDDTYVKCKICVKDTGIGMNEKFQEHAFEAFERERTSTESKIEGTGLGLAIVKKLVNLMNGSVRIQSERGQGTEISVSLPLRIAKKEDIHTKKISCPADLKGIKVLLVEDNELNAEIATELLSNMGLEVDWAEDGRACIDRMEAAEEEDYKMIFMDIQMPKLNGYDTTRMIRQFSSEKKAHIPIIAMTANAFDDDRKNAMEAGMDGFITKPIERNKAMQVISEIYKNS